MTGYLFNGENFAMIIQILDIFATFVFAVSGAFRAVKHELDLLGVLVLSAVTGVGGGMIRDALFGITPPMAFRNENYLLVCMLAGLTVFLMAPVIAKRWDLFLMADAVGLGLFSAIGAEKAVSLGLGPMGIMFSGAVTATGGGVIRDILVREIPDVIKEDFYATASIIGAAVFYSLSGLFPSNLHVFAASFLITMMLRFFAMKRKIHLPRVRRLPESPSRLTKKRKDKKH